MGGVLFKIQRKYKGNPAREARPKILGYFVQNTNEIQRKHENENENDNGIFYSKYKGNTKEIRRAKPAGKLFGVNYPNTKEIHMNDENENETIVFLFKIQRKHKGKPGREARRKFWGGLFKIQRKYKGKTETKTKT